MQKQILIKFIIAIISAPLVNASCQMTVGQATWDYHDGTDWRIPDVYTFEECFQECLSSNYCKGFTHQNQGVQKYCYLFRELNNLQACSTCKSGTVFQDADGVCMGGNTLANFPGLTYPECISECSSTANCVAATWFHQTDTSASKCYLFDACDETLPCEECQSGVIGCLEMPPQCTDYMTLDSAKRNIYADSDHDSIFYIDTYDGDTEDCRNKINSDWRGTSNYRIVPPAGVQIPEFYPGSKQCSTYLPGWLNTKHPTMIGVETPAQIVFGEYYQNTSITVTNCGDYHVYSLHNVDFCNAAYCGSYY